MLRLKIFVLFVWGVLFLSGCFWWPSTKTINFDIFSMQINEDFQEISGWVFEWEQKRH